MTHNIIRTTTIEPVAIFVQGFWASLARFSVLFLLQDAGQLLCILNGEVPACADFHCYFCRKIPENRCRPLIIPAGGKGPVTLAST